MLHVDGNGNIKLTRGDTALFDITIIDERTGKRRTLDENDTLVMTVKKTTVDTIALIRKLVTGVCNFKILPSDTSSLQYGKYKYDVQLTTNTGDVYTVILPSMFLVTLEVSF